MSSMAQVHTPASIQPSAITPSAIAPSTMPLQAGFPVPAAPRPVVRSLRGIDRELVLAALLEAVASAAGVLFARRVEGHIGNLTLLWPVGGMAAALALPHWQSGRMHRIVLTLAAVLGVVAGVFMAGMSLRAGISRPVMLLCELLVLCALLSPHVRSFDDLQGRDNILRLLISVLLAPAVGTALGELPLSWPVPPDGWHVLAARGLGDALGIAVTLPLCLLARDGPRGLRLSGKHANLRAALISVIFTAAVCGVFWQNTRPLLFMVFPPLILLLMELGLRGAVLSAVTFTTAGWFATQLHHGPIWLMPNSNPVSRLLLLQAFCLVCLLTALPVGAVLDERARRERSLRNAHAVHQLLIDHMDDAIVLSSIDGSQRYASQAVERLTGWTPAQFIALERFSVVHAPDRDAVKAHMQYVLASGKEEEFRFRLQPRTGDPIWVEANIRTYGHAGEVEGYVATLRDITETVTLEQRWQHERAALAAEGERLQTLASTDPLTQLFNRRGLAESIRDRQRRTTGGVALVAIDVDCFKSYNDLYGHPAGDECLVAIARLLRASANRFGDVVARIGGEEFLLLLPGVDEHGALAVTAGVQARLRSLALPHSGSPSGFVTLSFGISAHAGFTDEAAIAELQGRADAALYRSKNSGRNRATLYEAGMAAEMQRGELATATRKLAAAQPRTEPAAALQETAHGR